LLFALAFILGAAIGSFLNVCIYRLPHEESIIAPPSRCPKCNTRLRWRDLFPLFSQVLLGGRCRYCGQRISWRYFGVEFLTGSAFVIAVASTPDALSAAQALIIIAALIVVFFVDLDYYIIPDELPLVIAVVGLTIDFYHLYVTQQRPPLSVPIGAWVNVPIPNSLVGLVVSGGCLYGVAFLGRIVFKREAMGLGDVKLAAAVGANIGFGWQILSFFLLSIILGASVGVLLMLLKRKGGKDYIPFGPYLVIGAATTLLFGNVTTPFIQQIYTGGLMMGN
jgi:leader peptidase (prepilin peptidase)/N-methyltransferase